MSSGESAESEWSNSKSESSLDNISLVKKWNT
jgi:hypothetical protein